MWSRLRPPSDPGESDAYVFPNSVVKLFACDLKIVIRVLARLTGGVLKDIGCAFKRFAHFLR